MMQHIHYVNWTIEWHNSDYGHDFAIGNGNYRMDWQCVQPLYLGVGSFTLIEYGIDACKKLITEIIAEQEQVAIRLTVSYVLEHGGSTQTTPADD
jgi:hypothetical protein